MQTFIYRGRDYSGQAVFGEVVASTIEMAEILVEKKGFIPTRIKAKPKKFSLSLFKPKLKAKELANLSRQFEVMFSSGMPIEKVFRTLAEQAQNEGLKQALIGIIEDVAAGTRMSHAFQKYPQFFDPLYVNMIEMGQTGGILDKTLRELAKILQKEHSVNAKVNVRQPSEWIDS